jgi:nicotinamidase/pyrazinamidase
MNGTTALLIIDLQNDFCPGGSLPVPDGDRVVAPLNRAVELCVAAGLPVLASRDWHPEVTSHFRQYGGIWPAHCVQGSRGAQFHPALRLPADVVIVSKGMAADGDSYSAFDGVVPDGSSLEQGLRAVGVSRLIVGGLATDYCVKETVLAARSAGFAVTLLKDGIAGVELTPGDSDRALAAMASAGAVVVAVADLAPLLSS